MKRILAGRKAVEEYREAHAKLDDTNGLDHMPIHNELLSKLKELGFDSLQDFFAASQQANIEALSKAVIKVKYCDGCPGKEKKTCVAGCYDKAMEERNGPAEELRKSRAKRLANAHRFTPEHWASHLPLKVGDEFSMYPDCNILLRVIKEAEIDWMWR